MVGNRQIKYLVETALLGHGLPSIKNNDILSIWPKDAMLAWVEKGEIRIGTIEEFIPTRMESHHWERLNGLRVKKSLSKDVNSYLTASGTMVVAKELKCPVVVTAGIGGIGDVYRENLCYDLPALAQLGITLVATSPKDMLDIPATINWLEDHGVKVLGVDTEYCNGYILALQNYKLSGKLSIENANKLEYGCNLILNPIPKEKRLKDSLFLQEAIKSGKESEKEGKTYHPAVNASFDRLSSGISSKIQLESLVSNIKVAELITNNR